MTPDENVFMEPNLPCIMGRDYLGVHTLGILGSEGAKVVEGNQHINLRPLDFIEPKTTQNLGSLKYFQGPDPPEGHQTGKIL